MTATIAPEPLYLISLKAENVGILKAVRIDPDGETLILGGDNEQGKSTVIDCVMYALGGTKTIPACTIREGQDSGSITLDLGEFTVTRKLLASGNTPVKITTKDGLTRPSPQKFLDALVGAGLAFDPTEFIRLDEKKQLKIVGNLVGIDFTDHNAKRKELFSTRTMINVALKEAKALVERLPLHDGAPTEEVSIASLTEELEAARDSQDAAVVARDRVTDSRIRLDEMREDVLDAESQLVAALAAVERAKGHIARTKKSAKEQEAVIKIDEAATQKTEAAVIDPDPIRARIEGAESTNRMVRENARHREAQDEVGRRRTQSEKLTKQLDDIDEEKRGLLEAAEFPVPKLSLDENGVTYDGRPLARASMSRRLRIAMAIAVALNPRLRLILMREGCTLDAKSRRLVCEFAREKKMQALLEVVGKGEECDLIIEDGEIVEVRG
ncbi:MAG: AAA family ATPase [Candidatus Eisenbacteria sp.]|nr:AAA family ATPase [Candidatus Eisenbacteria bacterium]